jgi:hypothetical protein
MIYLRTYFTWLFPPIALAERRLLLGYIDQIHSDKQARIKKQMSLVNLVQKSNEGKDVNFYVIKHGKVVLDETWRVSDAEPKVTEIISSVTFHCGSIQYKADLIAVGGIFFSIRYNNRVNKCNDFKISSIVVHQSRIIEDSSWDS